GPEPTREAITSAVRKAIPLLEKGSAESTARVKCFTCHNQALPVFALTLAQSRGIPVDAANVKKQVELTLSDLTAARQAYLQGKGQGGGVVRAGYALLTLGAGATPSDATTSAVTEYLLLRDKEGWLSNANRPPSEMSNFTSTALALWSLQKYGTAEQKERSAARTSAAREWAVRTPAADTEDRAFRLWALKLSGAPEAAFRAAAQELRSAQAPDGGWIQKEGMETDAYATATVLFVLQETGAVTVDDPAYRRGLAFLIRTQLPDGSWFVKSRSKPFQPYYESGFPHGKDQFISITASSWAAAALAAALPASGM
ncbi:MAG: Prenyltransferase and squalene oxidase repeat protein, partial [Armatimonadetes bacterium]|nr:Prenyltransferase and squalene oxidase repeat protein [Armatimonadota bacterium]